MTKVYIEMPFIGYTSPYYATSPISFFVSGQAAKITPKWAGVQSTDKVIPNKVSLKFKESAE